MHYLLIGRSCVFVLRKFAARDPVECAVRFGIHEAWYSSSRVGPVLTVHKVYFRVAHPVYFGKLARDDVVVRISVTVKRVFELVNVHPEELERLK